MRRETAEKPETKEGGDEKQSRRDRDLLDRYHAEQTSKSCCYCYCREKRGWDIKCRVVMQVAVVDWWCVLSPHVQQVTCENGAATNGQEERQEQQNRCYGKEDDAACKMKGR